MFSQIILDRFLKKYISSFVWMVKNETVENLSVETSIFVSMYLCVCVCVYVLIRVQLFCYPVEL